MLVKDMTLMNVNICSWMSDCREKISGKTLQKILLPGSHHSGIYQTTRLKNNCISNKWGIHQGLTIIEQLHIGIRFFDLQVVYTDELEFRVYNDSYEGVTILEIIDQINLFLTKYPDEFIVIHVRQFMNCQNQPWTFGIHEHFYESCLVKLSLIASINSKYTLEQLWSRSERVLLVYGDNDQLIHQMLPLLSVYSQSVNAYTDLIGIHNTSVSSQIYQNISTSLNQSSWTNIFINTHILTTVDTKTIILGLLLPCFYPNSLRVKTRCIRTHLLDWCRKNLFRVNIILLDWVEDYDITSLVLLNCTNPVEISI